MSGFRHVGDREVARLHRIRVVSAEFEAPDGSTFERDVVRDIGWVGIVALLDDGRSVLLVRQYRGPIDADLLEIPAGVRDVPGEDPEVTAGRELAEEVGRRAAQLTRLARVHNSAGFTDEEGLIYLATGLEIVDTDLQGPEEQHMTVHVVDLADVPAMVSGGRLTDAKTIIGLLAAREHLGLR
ncbi:MAG: NUDIX hydrolase [Actinobacteria bacterium]|nr:NUDIX hydrolase [Actinomycetota bacterium]